MGYPIRDANGVLLLKAGVELTERMVSLLFSRGIRLVLSVKLNVVDGGVEGTEIEILNETTTIGRSERCDICPNDPLVSSVHCLIERTTYAVYITDRNSTNGTFVNDSRIQGRLELNDEDTIGFGEFRLNVHLDAALESDDGEAKKVARQILANHYGSYDVPLDKATMGMSRHALLNSLND